MWYHVSKPDEYLVFMGLGIDSMKIVKKGMRWPLQSIKRISISPSNYTFSLQSMSIEKLEFLLPAVFTIGPKEDPASLSLYARLLCASDNVPDGPKEHLRSIVRGVVEGETRVIAAGLSIEEIFKERRRFKELVIKNVQAELDQFGLFIYNANVKQLEDSPGSEYFVYLRKKSQEGAINQAKVDVSEARMMGDVGEKQKMGKTRQETCQIEADTTVFEQDQQKLISKAQALLKEQQAGYEQQVDIARIQARKACDTVAADLQKTVETQNAIVAQEKLRAEQLTRAKIDAEATKTLADAALYVAQKKADAKLYQETKRAEGLQYLYEAQSAGLDELVAAFNNNKNAALRYLMLEGGLLADLAKDNGEAMKGLNPKITVWKGDEGKADGMKDVLQGLAPLLTTLSDQTGINPPSWIAQMPNRSNNANSTPSSVPAFKV